MFKKICKSLGSSLISGGYLSRFQWIPKTVVIWNPVYAMCFFSYAYISFHVKKYFMTWPVGLSWLSIILGTKRLLVQFPNPLSGYLWEGTDKCFFFHINVSPSLSNINKIYIKLKKIETLYVFSFAHLNHQYHYSFTLGSLLNKIRVT